ncbi:MAG TPA: hypothetical protein VGF25_19175 [Thermoleophilaceae bacterium]|jgi:hypothetical protein
MILLDRFLPRYDVREFHSIAIDAPPEAVMDAARRLTLRDLPLSRLLIAIRGLRAERADVPLLDGFQRRGFMLLGEARDELVLGVVGRFWHPRDNVRPSRPEEFVPFAEPGFAKGAMNFRVVAEGGRTVFSTETRVLTTDGGARRRFRAYWLFVRPGSGVIRRDLLRAVKAASVRSTSSTVE